MVGRQSFLSVLALRRKDNPRPPGENETMPSESCPCWLSTISCMQAEDSCPLSPDLPPAERHPLDDADRIYSFKAPDCVHDQPKLDCSLKTWVSLLSAAGGNFSIPWTCDTSMEMVLGLPRPSHYLHASSDKKGDPPKSDVLSDK